MRALPALHLWRPDAPASLFRIPNGKNVFTWPASTFLTGGKKATNVPSEKNIQEEERRS